MTSNHWPGLGVSAEELEAKAEWVSRDHPRLTGATVMFFRTAGSLIRFSAHDFTLLPLAFFQTVVGLEKTLRIHYRNEREAFKELLGRAVADGVIGDATFAAQEPLNRLLVQKTGKRLITSADEFVAAIPEMRNQFFHGNYTLHPQLLPMALLVRGAADAVLNSTP